MLASHNYCSLCQSSQPAQSQADQRQPPGPSGDPKTAVDFWLKCIAEWYPRRLEKTYFLPPLYFRRTSHDADTVAGESVLVHVLPPRKKAKYSPQSNQTHPTPPVAGSVFTKPQDSSAPAASWPLPPFAENTRVDDEATERVLSCLRALSEEHGEVMMVMSQLEFRKYLDGKASPIYAAACALHPRPDTHPCSTCRNGEFDVLIIHRHYGLIVGEIKAVGAHMENILDLNDKVVEKVTKAVEQLEKAGAMLNHLVSGVNISMTNHPVSDINIIKTLFLPNVTSGQLTEAVSTDPQLEQDLCDCLGSDNLSQAVSRCLCSDQIPPLADLLSLDDESTAAHLQRTTPQRPSNNTVLSKLSAWWQQITTQNKGRDPQMSDEVYDQLLARFCGPATSVEVPTVTVPRKAVGKSAVKFTSASKVVRTTGQAVAEVGLILSTLALYPDQIDLLNDKTLQCVHIHGPPGTGKTVVLILKGIQWLREGHDVHVLSTSGRSLAVSIQIERHLRQVLGLRPGPSVHRTVIKPCDEKDVLGFAKLARGGMLHVIADEMPNYGLWNKLKEQVPTLSLWCASVERLDNPPSWLVKKLLTMCLRSPPAVTREVAKSQSFEPNNSFFIPTYSTPSTIAPSDGPPVRWLKHSKSLPGHMEGVPLECEECGKNVFQLLEELGVGKSAGPDNLEYRDVFILCEKPYDEVRNYRQEVEKDAPAMIQVLRDKGVPVGVVTSRNTESKVGDVALAVKNKVTVTDSETVSGLERRVVIGMGISSQSNTSRSAIRHRLMAMSRSTSLLVWIGNKPTL